MRIIELLRMPNVVLELEGYKWHVWVHHWPNGWVRYIIESHPLVASAARRSGT